MIQAPQEERKRMTDIIPSGKENALNGLKLAEKWHCSIREMSKTIQEARENGVIICACNAGYFKPETEEEMLTYYKTARKRSVTALATLKALRRELVKKGYNLNERDGERQ